MVELEKVDEQLMTALAWNIESETLLQSKEEELKVSCGVAPEAVDLQTRVAALTAELNSRAAEIEV